MKNLESPANGHTRIKALIVLVAVFALTASITFGARRVLGRSLDAQPSEIDLKAARLETAAGIPHLPDDTEDKLATALYPNIAAATSISDPFSAANVTETSTSATKVRMGPASLSTVSSQPVLPDRMARLTQWQQSVRAAASSGQPLPSISNAYLISELSPTGRVDMTGRQGAWLYLESEKRTIAANVGAKFYDGMLVGVNKDGISFRTSAGQTKNVPWSRQEDFTTTTPSLDASVPQRQPQVVPQVKPVSINRPSGPARPGDYSDLQDAVKQRYAQTSTTAQGTPVSNSANSTAISPENNTIITPTQKISPAKAVEELPDNKELSQDQRRSQREVSFNHASYSSTRFANARGPEPTDVITDGIDTDFEAVVEPSPTPSPSPSPIQASKAQASPEPQQAAATAPASKQKTAAVIPASSTAVTSDSSTAASQVRQQRSPLCDSSYRAENITVTNESNRPLSLLTLVNRFNEAYAANIVLDYDVQETPVRLTISDAPWTSVLRTLLDLNDLDMVCIDGRIVQIAKRMKIAQISEQKRRSAPIVREVFKLRYLQPTAGGRANLAGQTQSTNGATIQSLEDAIKDILKAGGDARGEARRVPGRNELLVAATQEQMAEIRDIISRVDRPGYQVKISALVYTANENFLRDIGSQLSIAAFNTDNTNIAGLTTLPNQTTSSGSGSGTGTGNNGQGASGRNPGGIPGLAAGMRQPTNGLSATNPLATFGGSYLFNSFQFAYQLTLAQQSGNVNIQSRPFGIVSDGDTFDLVAGTQIPVVTTTIAGGAPFQSGQVQFIEASRIARITPQVAENEQGQPNFVTLNIQLENNSVDTSLGTFNGVPGVNRQSLQTVLRLRNGETVVIGGLAADQVSNAKAKVPGLGDIPLIGNAFKRKQNQQNRDRLYFAITVEVIPLDAAMPNFQAPADAMTTQPAPPKAQKPSPFEKRN